jgi:hypothetical protein
MMSYNVCAHIFAKSGGLEVNDSRPWWKRRWGVSLQYALQADYGKRILPTTDRLTTSELAIETDACFPAPGLIPIQAA